MLALLCANIVVIIFLQSITDALLSCTTSYPIIASQLLSSARAAGCVCDLFCLYGQVKMAASDLRCMIVGPQHGTTAEAYPISSMTCSGREQGVCAIAFVDCAICSSRRPLCGHHSDPNHIYIPTFIGFLGSLPACLGRYPHWLLQGPPDVMRIQQRGVGDSLSSPSNVRLAPIQKPSAKPKN